MTRVPPRLLDSSRRRARAIQTAVLGAMLSTAWLVNPDRPLPFDVCWFKILTGVPCPTCGLTRATCHALHGNWLESMNYHPAGILAAAVLAGWTVWSLAEAARGTPLGDRLRAHASTWVVRTGAAIAVANWVVRLATGTWPGA